MSSYYGSWAPYVPVAERRAQAAREMEKLRKKGATITPVTLATKTIAATFWGKAWCENLESYHDYENRLPRGRTYIRNGSVVDLQIAPCEVTAMVSGSSIYKVKITIGEVAKTHWKSICTDCSGGIDSLVELLQGRFSKGVMERICRQGAGLFPKPSEIKFSCSCPDYASMCKHVAAALYGVGARLDAKPELLFRLRAVNENELVADIGKVLPLTKQGPLSGKVLELDDMAALFGLDMGDADEPAAATASKSKAATATKSTPAALASPTKSAQAATVVAKLKNAPKPAPAAKQEAGAVPGNFAKAKEVPKLKVMMAPKPVAKPKALPKLQALVAPTIAATAKAKPKAVAAPASAVTTKAPPKTASVRKFAGKPNIASATKIVATSQPVSKPVAVAMITPTTVKKTTKAKKA